MLAGKRWSAGFRAEDRDELFRVHRRDLVRAELATEPHCLRRAGPLNAHSIGTC